MRKPLRFMVTLVLINKIVIILWFTNNSIIDFLGTYEKVEEEEEEIYEVINVHKLKSATPNLRVINLYGINFIDDSHIDAFSSNCIQVSLNAVFVLSYVMYLLLSGFAHINNRQSDIMMDGQL